MGKKKTSKERGFSFDAMPASKVRARRIAEHDPKKKLRDHAFVVDALTQALIDGDAEAFKEILAAHLEVVEKESFYRKAGISRRTLYRMLAPSGNPTLDHIARVVKAIAKEAA